MRMGGELNYTGIVFSGDSTNSGAGLLSGFTTKVFATLSNKILKAQALN
jgi:hypothetical protein